MLTRQRLVDLTAAGALAVSVMSGKMAVPVVGELRLPATLIALALLIPALQRWRPPFELLPIGALITYLFAQSLFFDGDLTVSKRVDLVYLAVQIGLVSALAASRERLAVLAVAIVGLSTIYLAIALIWNDGFGLGWGPIGTALTFNRTMFLAFCAVIALGALFGRNSDLAPLFGFPFLAACLASSQKSAVLAASLAFCVMAALMLVHRRHRMFVAALAAGAVSVVLASIFYGDRIAHRMETAVTPTVTNQVEGVSPKDALFSISMRYCQYKDESLICTNQTLTDGTARLLLWVHALTEGAESPLIGWGYGMYEAVLVHPNTLERDPYSHPHNMFAEMFYEAGAIGVVLLGVALIAGFHAMSGPPGPARTAIIGYIAFMLVTVMLSGDFYDTRTLWLAFAVLVAMSPPGKELKAYPT